LSWWEDTPDRVDADIKRAVAKQTPAQPASKSATASAAANKTPAAGAAQTSGAKGAPANTTANATKTDNTNPASRPDAGTASKGSAENAQPGATPTDRARALLVQARKALQANQFEKASKLTSEARALKPHLNWWEDTPDRVDADINRAVAKQTPAQPASKSATASAAPANKTPAVSSKQEAVGLVQKGRQALTQSKFDEAIQSAQKAKAMATVTWGLFEDSPDRLLIDIQKARHQRDQAESVKVLIDGRKLLDKGDLEGATRAAYKAERLHGPYNIWDLGDRPARLLDDIQSAQARNRRTPLPPPVLVKKSAEPQKGSNTASPASKPDAASTGVASLTTPSSGLPPIPGTSATASGAVAVAKTTIGTPPALVSVPGTNPSTNVSMSAALGSQGGTSATASGAVAVAKTPSGTPQAPVSVGETTLSTNLPISAALVSQGGTTGSGAAPFPAEAATPRAPTTPSPAEAATPRAPTTPSPAELAAIKAAEETARQAVQTRLRAQQLVRAALDHHAKGELLEARERALDAQRLHVVFGPEETSPEMVLQLVAVAAHQRIDRLIQQAQNTMAGTGEKAALYARAKAMLQQAHQLASTFGQDTNAVDQKLAWLEQVRSSPAPAQPAASGVALTVLNTPANPAPAPPANVLPTVTTNHGRVLLDKARMELRKGQLSAARQMTEEAWRGNYGVQEEAAALLRSIDTEQFNQNRLQAQRSFDAAMSAFNRGDAAHAGTLLSAIDYRLLDPARQARLREVMNTPQMQPGHRAAEPVGVARATDQNPGTATPGATGNPAMAVNVNVGVGADPRPAGSGLVPVAGSERGSPAGAPGRAQASDRVVNQDDGLLDHTRQMRQVIYDKARLDGLEVQKAAAERFRAGQTDEAIELLENYLAQLDQTQLDARQLGMLQRPVKSRLNHFKLLKAQKELTDGATASRQANNDRLAAGRKAEQLKQKNVEKLMKEYNAYFKDGKYLEAETAAMKAHEIDPDNAVASTAMLMARRQINVARYHDLKDRKERLNLEALNDADDEGPPDVIEKGLVFDRDRLERARKRGPLSPIAIGRKHPSEKEIERKLTTPITLSFQDAPLATVIDDLRTVHNVNIVVDTQAMQEDGISLDSPVSIKLMEVSLRSALNLILHQCRLTWIIKDEVLQITTEAHAKDRLKPTTYQVADLVIPIESFGDIRNPYIPPNLGTPVNPPQPYAPTPLMGSGVLPGGTPTGSAMGPQANGSTPFASAQQSGNGTTVSRRPANNTMEETLIKLITSTIAPRSWSDMGGPGTIEYFPLTMALVINQTADIQEQIADLLASLRRLQDQEVSVEIRFITVREDFFERIGVNFNLNIVRPEDNIHLEPNLTTGNFAPQDFINAFRPQHFLAGLTPAGTLTSTLDIPITNSTFTQSIPTFGGYQGTGGGGLTLGLAFLSDIQVFLFLEAVQGDVRSNIMQAPKLTLFNGQSANLSVRDTQFFVTGVNLINSGQGQFFYQPTVQAIDVALQTLTIQAVISADRRFVRMSLTPTLQQAAPGAIQIFPIVSPIYPLLDQNGGTGQPVVFTQYIQQPVLQSISVLTTVAVPDGGTILLGGLKRVAESRSEFGPPILSKIPYVNRLFKNVGYGRETSSLLMMVTPRIIIQEEEEERQTGFIRPEIINRP
jgi:type II secretory pathway component GspD/PulD (secretin)